jgi:putative solute:sodium symporter small subunit
VTAPAVVAVCHDGRVPGQHGSANRTGDRKPAKMMWEVGTMSDNAGKSNDAYWKANITLIAVSLVIWFVVSYGFGILLVEPLNAIEFGGFKLGFWFAQQGAIYVFLILIAVYAIVMNSLDRKHGVDEQ